MDAQSWIAVRRALIALAKAVTPKEKRDAAIMLSKTCEEPERRDALMQVIAQVDQQVGIKAK